MQRNLRTLFLIAGCLCHLLVAEAKAQWLWQVEQYPNDDGTPVLYSLSCAGNNCTLCEIPEPPYFYFERTTDGGLTWTQQDPGIGNKDGDNNNLVKAVQQIDSLNVVAVGNSNLILRSTDAGVTWFHQSPPATNPPCSSVANEDFSDSMSGIATIAKDSVYSSKGGDTVIYFTWSFVITTSDAGAHWAVVPPLVPGGAYVESTTDNSAHWVVAPLVPGGGAHDYGGGVHAYGGGKFRVFDFIGNKTYTTTDSWHSVDTGESLPDSIPGSGFYYQVEQPALSIIFAGGDTILIPTRGSFPGKSLVPIVFRSFDGGDHWQAPDTTGRELLYSSYTPFNRDTIAEGEGYIWPDTTNYKCPFGYGKIYLSTDRGNTWRTVIDSFQYEPVSGYYGGFAITGIALMPNGSILATYGNKNSFIALALPPTPDLVQSPEKITSSLSLFPNPATSVLNFEPPSGTFTISDPLGRNYDVPHIGSKLDVSALPPGVYFVSDGASRTKFVKE